MKKRNVWKTGLSLILSVGLAASVAGCASSSGSAPAGGSAGAATEAEKAEGSEAAGSEAAGSEESSEAAGGDEAVTYYIATEGDYAPYNLVNDKGEPDGYDIAVARAVDELLPDVRFEYQAVEWSSIFAGLEADRYDLIVSQAAKTPEREEKYLFADVPYTWGVGAIAYQAGRTDIKSMDDLAGKTLSIAVGSSNANVAETWNAEHGNVIELVYNDGDITKALLDVQEGRVDATLVSPVVGNKIITEQGLSVEFVLRNDDIVKPTYWLYPNSEKGQALKEKVDGALNTLLENGKLAEISKEYLGDDYTTEEAVTSRVGK